MIRDLSLKQSSFTSPEGRSKNLSRNNPENEERMIRDLSLKQSLVLITQMNFPRTEGNKDEYTKVIISLVSQREYLDTN